MSLVNLGSNETSFHFRPDGDVGKQYFCKFMHLDAWAGGPFYWHVKTESIGVPLEFMFDGSGRLSGVSVTVAGNVQMLSTAPLVVGPLRDIPKLPRVSLDSWPNSRRGSLEQTINLQAWWQDSCLWILQEKAVPASAFDTSAGARVLFDASNQFIGTVLVSLTRDDQIALVQAAAPQEVIR